MPRKMEDITGKRFGRLVVLRLVERKPNYRYMWLCQCDCGNQVVVERDNLGRGIVSCGCKRLEDRERNQFKKKHGQAKTRLYGVWGSMIDRCTNPNAHEYENYGGRGIEICDEWRNSYEAFEKWAMANGYDENSDRKHCLLDRIDNDKNYEPTNCRFTTMKAQNRNKRSNVLITYNGETHCLSEWAEIAGIKYGTFLKRIYAGWSMEDAMNKPLVYNR